MSSEDLIGNLLGVVAVDEFMDLHLPPLENEESDLDSIRKRVASGLEQAKERVNAGLPDGEKHPLAKYLAKVVSGFPEVNRPSLFNYRGHVSEGEDVWTPDILASRPPFKDASLWERVGTMLALKHNLDIIDANDQILKSSEATEALAHLADNARRILVTSGSCHVFLVACFDDFMARIFRFDHGGFVATAAFNWYESPNILHTFFYRLYNTMEGRLVGDDDTMFTPTTEDKNRMYAALIKHEFYHSMYETVEAATEESLWIKAVRFRVVGDERVAQVVKCFTIGDPLSVANVLFGRATRVYRVILEEDIDQALPTIYVLKVLPPFVLLLAFSNALLEDAWPSVNSRPEIDFYDAIARHCAENGIDTTGMAMCHGSVNVATLSTVSQQNADLHVTLLDITRGRRQHDRMLMTPVGTPLCNFDSPKSLVQALYCALQQHEIAYDAGVLHRDISEGNILLHEVPAADGKPRAFLHDFDCAEFTRRGLEQFEERFPDRRETKWIYRPLSETLTDAVGTYEFMSIERQLARRQADGEDPGNDKIRLPVGAEHGPYHDLESLYWVLVWMILQYTNYHMHSDRLTTYLFDWGGWPEYRKYNLLRVEWKLAVKVPPAFKRLVEGFREYVSVQSLRVDVRLATRVSDVPVLKHEILLKIFERHLSSLEWENVTVTEDPMQHKRTREDADLDTSDSSTAASASAASASTAATAVSSSSETHDCSPKKKAKLFHGGSD
ncbi:Pkinase-fungal domain-containing protein [Favolaschia claudopus]|uniref:Pkinase-fungal domain-containing protein n=1 Tax=Favolaschia claudopus TaxID=2862362 RepID=A0AAW0D9Q1_9AGAR